MKSSERSLIDEIFLSAVELEPDEARAAFLDKRCNGLQPSVREEVDRLLAADRGAERAEFSLTSVYVDKHPEHGDTPFGRQGDTVGRYRLLQELGAGGMGVVYMAEQREPVRRRVAIKLIKPGMDSEHVVARFEAERQALAMMDHPGIAKVLDVGTTENGRPYFVMELVKGKPITQYCDERRLNLERRLELFVSVCLAVQHAHQKGVIHRDLKPSNVLVAEYDNVAIPKVIDFGLAKALQQPLTEKTVFTQLGQIVGTFEYMSPEQAKLNQLDIDTRADIYSLGVLLYELLTGHTPFDPKTLRSAAFDEMLRIIRESEPAVPSAKLASSESSAEAAESRRVEPAQLTRRLRGDLDAIAMKALDKERARRYATSSALAEDVQRFLNDEPITAARPSYWRACRSFVKRNRFPVAAATVVVILLASSSVVSTTLLYNRRLIASNRMLIKNQIIADMPLAHDAWRAGDVMRTRTTLEKYKPKQEGKPDLRTFEWGYLSRLCQEAERNAPVFSAPKSIQRLAFRGPSDQLFIANEESLHVRTADNAHDVALEALSPYGSGIDISPKGDRVVFATYRAAGDDVSLVLRETKQNGKELHRVNYEEQLKRLPRFSPKQHIIHVVYSSDGKHVATTHSQETFVLLWRVTDDDQIVFDKLLEAPPLRGDYGTKSDWIRCVCFSHDGTKLAAGDYVGTVRVWDVASGETVSKLPHEGTVYSLAFTHDDSRLVAGSTRALSMGLQIKSWDCSDLANSEHAKSLHLGQLKASCLAISPASNQLATGGSSGLVRLIDLESFRELRTYRGALGKITSIQFSRDGRQLATTTQGRRDPVSKQIAHDVHLWPVHPSGRPKGPSAQDVVTLHKSPVRTIAFHPSKNHLAAADWNGLVSIINTDSLEVLDQRDHGSYLDHVEFVKDGTKLAYGAGGRLDTGGGTWIWDLENPGNKPVELVVCWMKCHPERELYFRVRGDWLAKQHAAVYAKYDSAIEDSTFPLFRSSEFRPIGFGVAAFAPRRPLLAMGGQHGWVAMWNVEQKVRMWHRSPTEGHSSHVTACAVAPDEMTVATASAGGSCILWRLRDGQRLHTLVGHSSDAYGVDYSPREGILATASADGTVRLWDVETGVERFSFRGNGAGFWSVQFSHDGQTLAAADNEGTIWIWRN